MDVFGYFDDREREALEVSGNLRAFSAAAEEGSADQRGRLIGEVDLTDTAYVQFHEIVHVEGTGITRERYAYFLVVDGQEIGGFERDPMHLDESVHMHCAILHGHDVRFPAETVSFKAAITMAWEYLSTGRAPAC